MYVLCMYICRCKHQLFHDIKKSVYLGFYEYNGAHVMFKTIHFSMNFSNSEGNSFWIDNLKNCRQVQNF